MKNTIWVNFYDSNISNEELSAIFTEINIDPHNGFDGEVKVSLWHLSTMQKGYGHWKISVELELNGRKLTITTTTTNSIAIDDFRSEEGEKDEDGNDRNSLGFQSLLNECIRNNEDEIIDFVIGEE